MVPYVGNARVVKIAQPFVMVAAERDSSVPSDIYLATNIAALWSTRVGRSGLERNEIIELYRVGHSKPPLFEPPQFVAGLVRHDDVTDFNPWAVTSGRRASLVEISHECFHFVVISTYSEPLE
jgi:hypothetical protein